MATSTLLPPSPRSLATPSDPPQPSTSSEPRIDQLIETHTAVARSMAARYRNRGIDLDDREQVARLGLSKAARRFRPDSGPEFMAFAAPTIRGELRRHFRDAGWVVRPPRRVQELQARVGRARDELEPRLGRSPRPSELAAHLDEDVDDVVEALSADGCFTPTSLDGPVGDGSSTEDHAVASAEARVVLDPLVRRLSDRERRILQMRFVEDRTQKEIGAAVGLTQAQVSRVLARILDTLRSELAPPPTAA